MDNVSDFYASYLVAKHSWKGKYFRILRIGPKKIVTLDPKGLFRVTNSWDLELSIVLVQADSTTSLAFSLTSTAGGKQSKMLFSCSNPEERMELLTYAHRSRMLEGKTVGKLFEVELYQGRNSFVPATFCISRIGISEFHHKIASGVHSIAEELLFINIKGYFRILHDATLLAIAYGKQCHFHVFRFKETKELNGFLSILQTNAKEYIGFNVELLGSLTMNELEVRRTGLNSKDFESVADFPVVQKYHNWCDIGTEIGKNVNYNGAPPPANCFSDDQLILSISPSVVVERRRDTYANVRATALSDILSLVRCQEEEQKFMIISQDPPSLRTFISPMRDAILAQLCSAACLCKNNALCITSYPIHRAVRFGMLGCPVATEVESSLLFFLAHPEKLDDVKPPKIITAVSFFNANVQYSGLSTSENQDGLFSQNRDRLIQDALYSVLSQYPTHNKAEVIVERCSCLRRLCLARAAFSTISSSSSVFSLVSKVLSSALRYQSYEVQKEAIDWASVLVVSHHEHYELRDEINNKLNILAIPNFISTVISILARLIGDESRITYLQSVLIFFTHIVCVPHSETTPANTFIKVMKELVDRVGKKLFWLLSCTCADVHWNAARIIKSICEEGDEEQFQLIQQWSISEGGFLREFHIAAFSKNREQRDLARTLLSYWTYNNTDMQDILRRMVPVSLLFVLQSKEIPEDEEKTLEIHRFYEEATDEYRNKRKSWIDKAFGSSLHEENVMAPPVLLRSRNIRSPSTLNWPLFFAYLNNDCRSPHLIWNHMTRAELRQGIENEMELFQKNVGIQAHATKVAWNYLEFEISYPSLQSEIKVGDHYPRLLFEHEKPEISRPKDFFNDLYHRFLLVTEQEEKNFYLQGMTVILKYYAESIGSFHDTPYFVEMLRTTLDPIFRDSLVEFFYYLINAKQNAKFFIDSNGPAALSEFLSLAHLHVDRPKTYTITNAIQAPVEGDGEEIDDHCKVWFYTSGEERCGPFSFMEIKMMFHEGKIGAGTKMWAQGISSWMALQDIPHLKWGVLSAKIQGKFSFFELSSKVLDIFLNLCDIYPSTDKSGSVMSPLPKIKRFLSDPLVFPHLVQLLLTFDSGICTRVHRLLCSVLESNPICSRIYCTGVFFFALMYSGSDVLPLITFLRQTHQTQSYKFSDSTNEAVQSSILAPMLPPAVICTLTYKDENACASAFLQECENPEIIWSTEMRSFMISKIAAHVFEFTTHLLNNSHTVYQYCPIEKVEYLALKNELFCYEYYLRHLCDTSRFSHWKIRDPVRFLSELLQRWKAELAETPESLTLEECYEVLELKIGDRAATASSDSTLSRNEIRQVYLKLLPKYHPDKNPNGREVFEKIQKAYEYLLSENFSGVDKKKKSREHIFWILKALVIVYQEYREDVAIFKYPGFRPLVQLLKQEIEGDRSLRQPSNLLLVATELCSATIATTPLNADELLDEGGITLLISLLGKCFDHFSIHSKEEDPHVKIAIHCVSSLAIAGELEECRTVMKEKKEVLSRLIVDGMSRNGLLPLVKQCIAACISMTTDPEMQKEFVEAGAQWHLLKFLFAYDATTDHQDIQWDEASHKAFLLTNVAFCALQGLYTLAGNVPDPVTYSITPPFEPLQKCLDALLTPYITGKMKYSPHTEKEILKLLNSTEENPYFVWNNATKHELLDLMDRLIERTQLGESMDSIVDEIIHHFSYTAHKNLLTIGNVHLQLYLSHPNFPINEPQQFFLELCKFMTCKCSFSSHSDAENVNDTTKTGDNDLLVVVKCLSCIVSSYPVAGVEAACTDVNSLLNLLCIKSSSVLEESLNLQEHLFSFPEYCAAAEKTSLIPSRLGQILVRSESTLSEKALAVLQVSLTYRAMVEQSLHQKLYILLLYFCLSESSSATQKEKAAQCLAVAFSDKLFGAQWYLSCNSFLPRVFLDSIKDNFRLTSHLLCTWQDNPELYWTTERKKRVEKALEKEKTKVLEGWSKASDKGGLFKFETAFELSLESLKEERELADVSVGEVYLQSYLAHPGWLVRNPKEFAVALLDRFFAEAEKNSVEVEQEGLLVELLVKCILQLFQKSPHLCDLIAPLGYSKKLVHFLSSSSDVLAYMSLQLLLALSRTNRFVETLSSHFVLRELMCFVNRFPQHTLLWLRVVQNIAKRSTENCMTLQQALDFHVVEHLLGILSDPTTQKTSQSDDPAIIRALIIRILKQLLILPEPLYISSLQRLLEENSNWKKYRDYNHDLFLGVFNPSSGDLLTEDTGAPTLFLKSTQHFASEPPSVP